MTLTYDAGEFKESDHPRGQPGNAGQFGSGGGGGAKKQEAKAEKATPKAEASAGKSKSKESKGAVAPREAQQAGVDGIANYLGMIGKAQSHQLPKGWKTSHPQFVKENGYPFTFNEKTFQGKRAPMHECYKNAALDALNNPDRTYVEGYVSVHGVPIEHAWTVDASGQVYDSTIRGSNGIQGYFGVPFSPEYLMKSLLKNKVYGLLGYESRKTLDPLMKGEAKDFKAVPDPDKLSDEAIQTRLNYAERASRAIEPTDKIDTPERQALRKQITDKLYNKDIDKRKRERKATIFLGLPASGKSTLAQPVIDRDGALEVDPDLAKAELPEYQGGIGAYATHEESSGITRNVMAEALKNGDNIAWPRVDSPDKVARDIENLKKLGYTVDLQFLDVKPETAEHSAISRYIKTNRYVSPLTIKEFGDTPRQAYEAGLKVANSHSAYRREGHNITKIED